MDPMRTLLSRGAALFRKHKLNRDLVLIAAIGVAAGIPLALIAGHFMSSMLYGLEPYDKLTLAAALIGVVGISLASGYLPARRATSIDPMRALRTE